MTNQEKCRNLRRKVVDNSKIWNYNEITFSNFYISFKEILIRKFYRKIIQTKKLKGKEERLLSKKKKIVLIVAVLSCLILSFIGGQSYSKYVSEVRGDGMAEVATWSFKVNGQKEEVQTIQLGSTCNNETLVNNKIAPGTSGSFNIIVDGTGSDVGIDYHIQFTNESTKPTNLKFMYGNQKYDSITELENILSGTINANDEEKTRTLTINWQWEYETGSNESEIANNDKIDTKNAQDIATYTFNVIVSGTQVVPQT